MLDAIELRKIEFLVSKFAAKVGKPLMKLKAPNAFSLEGFSSSGEESTEEYCYQWNLCPEVEEEESRNLRAFVYAVIRGDFDQVGFWLSQGVNPDRIPPKSSEYTVVQLAVMNRISACQNAC